MSLSPTPLALAIAFMASISSAQGGLSFTWDFQGQGRPCYVSIQSTHPCWQTIEILGVTAVEHGQDHATFHDVEFTADSSAQFAEASWDPPGLPLPPDDDHHLIIVYYRYYDLCTEQWHYASCSEEYYAS